MGKIRTSRVLKFLGLVALFTYTSMFLNCGMVQRPTAQSMMGSGFAHQGIATGCASCHDVGKPFDSFHGISGVLTNQMIHDGMSLPDCSACHFTSSKASDFTSWQCEAIPAGSVTLNSLGTFHTHINATSCATCHANMAPQTATTDSKGNAVPAHDANFLAGNDCAICHSQGSGLDWTNASVANHTPTATNCASCHATGGSQPAAYNAIAKTVTNQMLHTYAGLPDCFACHRATAVSNGFTLWNVEAVPNNSTGPLASLGIFHTNFTPTTCQDCHSGSRPATPQGSPIAVDHTVSPANGDCVSCHTTNVGLNWTGAQFPHTPTPTSCANCHLSELPPTANLYPTPPTSYQSPGAYNHDSTYGTECFACHTQTSAAKTNIGKSWGGGYFDHSQFSMTAATSCEPCHMGHPGYKGVTVQQAPYCLNCHNPIWPSSSQSPPSYGGKMSP